MKGKPEPEQFYKHKHDEHTIGNGWSNHSPRVRNPLGSTLTNLDVVSIQRRSFLGLGLHLNLLGLNFFYMGLGLEASLHHLEFPFRLQTSHVHLVLLVGLVLEKP
jgi:hypothetical protein